MTHCYAAGMGNWALYTPKKNTCLRIFRLFVALRATGQRRTLVQAQRGPLMLPARRWKRKWRVASCSWYAKSGTFHTEKIYLLANLSFVHGAEGDGTTSHSCANTKGSIDASSSSLEAQMGRCFMQLVCGVGDFTHRKNLPACESFVCSWYRGRRDNVALLCNCERVH